MWPKRLRPPSLPYLAIALVLFVADQLSKFWAVGRLTNAYAAVGAPLGWGALLRRFLWTEHPQRTGVVTVAEHFWHYRYVENPGAAWGFLSGSASSLRTPFFLVVSLFAMGYILAYFRRTHAGQRVLRGGLALVFGGAVGNFCDRVRLGYVIDFIDWHWYDRFTWPTFNVADAGITIGVIILLLEMSFNRPEPAAVAIPPIDPQAL